MLRGIHTPGHSTDHFSFFLNHSDFTETYLFSGDIILGTPSTKVECLIQYMDTLYKLRKENFSYICLPHTVDLNPDSIIVEGKPKLEAYIHYREEREIQIK